MGDFNRDGIEDLVATNPALNQVAVILGNGDGTFNAPAYYPARRCNRGMLWLAISTRMDFWTLRWPRTVAVRPPFFRATAMAHSSRLSIANTGASQVGSVALGDFNGDGLPDLATTSAPDNAVYILMNKGTAIPSFGPAAKIHHEQRPLLPDDWRLQS